MDTRDFQEEETRESMTQAFAGGGDIMATLAERLREEGMQKGMQQGMQRGAKQEKLAAARRMLQEDLPLENISRYTGLSIKEIQKMK